ncbi:MAG: DUF167 domain-containing protein [Phycisphaerae bacterium]|nr:DUF167 domain-containing protein [Phycisphaerae bacterium]
MSLDIQHNNNSITFPVKIVPGSSKNKIAGLLGNSLKINIAAAPEKGKANKQLIAFLAKKLKIPTGDIEIVAGMHDARKKIKIYNLKLNAFTIILNEIIK